MGDVFAECTFCRQTFERDYALQVKCPTCGVEPGEGCKRPSEHATWNGPHKERVEAGVSEVCPHDTEPCW